MLRASSPIFGARPTSPGIEGTSRSDPAFGTATKLAASEHKAVSFARTSGSNRPGSSGSCRYSAPRSPMGTQATLRRPNACTHANRPDRHEEARQLLRASLGSLDRRFFPGCPDRDHCGRQWAHPIQYVGRSALSHLRNVAFKMTPNKLFPA